MKPDELEILKEHIETVIKTTVNGKIDKLNDKVDQHNIVHEGHMKNVCEYMEKTDKHIENVAPILEAYNGTKALGNLTKWLGGIIITIGAVWAIFFK